MQARFSRCLAADAWNLRDRSVRAGLLACLFAVAIPAVHAQADVDREDFDVGIGLLRRGLHDDAARQFRRYVERHPRAELAPEAWYRLGTCYEKLGDAGKAIQSLDKALSFGQMRHVPECLYRLGKLLQKAGRKDAAHERLAELVRKTDAKHYLHVAGLYADGECLRDLKQREAAVASFLSAAKLERDAKGAFGLPALYHAGFLLMALGRFGEASGVFASAAKRWPDNEAAGECLHLAGEALYRGEDFVRAETAYRKAIAAGGKYADDAQMGLAWCQLKRAQPEDAIASFLALAQRYPESPLVTKARLEAGRLLYKERRYAPAREQLETVLESDSLTPKVRATALELRGLACLDSGAAPVAADSFARALTEEGIDDATRARLAYDLGEALAEQQLFKRALTAYDTAIEAADPSLRGDALYGAALALHRLGRHKDSARMAERLVDELPKHRLVVQARFALGEDSFALGDWAKADEFFATIPGEHVLGRKAAFKRAWCAYLAGRHKDAAARFARLAGRGDRKDPIVEEALSMQALSAFQAGDSAGALTAADRYVARYPEGAFLARTERVAAQVLQAKRDFRGAAKRLARAAGAETSQGRVAEDRLQQAELLFKQGDFEAAAKSYSALAADASLGAKALVGLAWCAFELGDDEPCIEHIEAAIAHPKVGKDEPAMLELLSSVYHRAKRWEEAIAAAKRFLSKFGGHPRSREMRYALGVAQARDGDFEAARATLEGLGDCRGLERPDRAFYELAWACRRLKDQPAALAAFGRVAAISKDPDLAGEANLHLGQAALDAKDTERARGLFAKVAGRYEPQALYRAGFSLLEEGKNTAALPLFERILGFGPKRSKLYDEAQFLAGECRYREQRYKAAAANYRKLLERSPDHDRAQVARLHLGECAARTKDAAAAIAVLDELLRRGIEGKAENARALLWLGKAHLARHEYGPAEAAFAKVPKLSTGPLAAEAQFRIGESRVARGKPDDAVGAFLKLSLLYADKQWVSRGLLETGRCYAAMGQPAKAKKFFAELLDKHANSSFASEARAELARLKGN